jgi:hypothetical protein
MVWATPGNIITTNVDNDSDSIKDARPNIKSAFDELSNIANNAKVSWTPAYELSAGSFTNISYSTQTGNYIKMGAIIFWEFKVVADITIDTNNGADLTAYNADLKIGGLPVNPSSVQTYHGRVTEAANFLGNKATSSTMSDTSPGTLQVDTTGTRLKIGSSILNNEDYSSTLEFASGSNVTNIGSLPSGAAQNNVTIAGNGWYMV